MSLSYTKTDKSTGTTRISFDPPLLDYEEVRVAPAQVVRAQYSCVYPGPAPVDTDET